MYPNTQLNIAQLFINTVLFLLVKREAGFKIANNYIYVKEVRMIKPFENPKKVSSLDTCGLGL
jgi:alpha-D-ribose 1-methylphosphonate 5-triphosphate synthase subunit PhnI